jgi:hypothetical protein
MKIYLTFILLLTSNLLSAQIYGDIAIDKRPVVSQIEYAFEGSYNGQFVFDIVVDEKGNVTSCKLDKAKTNITSTPTMMEAKNRVKRLKFEAGYQYPQFHRGEVVIKVYTKK